MANAKWQMIGTTRIYESDWYGHSRIYWESYMLENFLKALSPEWYYEKTEDNVVTWTDGRHRLQIRYPRGISNNRVFSVWVERKAYKKVRLPSFAEISER